MNDLSVISAFVMDKLDGEPIARRIQLKRALAEIVPTPKQRAALLKMADDLEAIERRHRQLVLDFQRRAEG